MNDHPIPADPIPPRLGVWRIAAAAITTGILVEVALSPLFYLHYRVGFGGTAMLVQFGLALLVTLIGVAFIGAAHHRMWLVLPAALWFSLLYSLVSQLTRFGLIEPTAEIGGFTNNLLVMLRVGVMDSLFILVLVLVPSFFLAKLLLQSRGLRAMLRPGDCWECGYSLEGLPPPKRCPECGTSGNPVWPTRSLAMLALGESTNSRRARHTIGAIAVLLSIAIVARLAWSEAHASPSVQLVQGQPSHFAEPQNGAPPPSRLGKSINVNARFGITAPYKLELITSLNGESPPRAQLLLMHSTPAFGGVGSVGIAFGELTTSQATDIKAGNAPPEFLQPISKYITYHSSALATGRRIPHLQDLWSPPQPGSD